MDKKQFLQFKSDLKDAIQVTKIENKHSKKWWNLGFPSEEEYKKVHDEDVSKIKEIESHLPKDERGHILIWGSQRELHWAYYSAKHRLDEQQRDEYVKEMFGKMREETKNQWPYYGSYKSPLKKVEEIIKFYETLVCPD